ncbi:MAG: hypothetical protein HY646_14235, partial [Acidobacteria bacterium]|nr:hypothetical protein [Acidobacteriota bacterium]
MEKQKQRGERRITPPSLEEWAMFEKCPEHHRQYCLDYEYCREPESKHIRKVITDWCGPDAASILETVLGNSAALYLHGKLPELCLPLADLLIRFPEFPEKSFLEIPEATRTERLPVVPSIEPLEGFKWENLVNE